MTHKRSSNFSFVSEGPTRSQAPKSATLAWMFLIVGGLCMTGASAVYGQEKTYGPADPVPPNPVSGRTVSIATITSADVLARVELLRASLEQIRLEMGQPTGHRVAITATNVASRETVFQAFTLLRKASHLRFEVTGYATREEQITIPSDIRPLHTWKIVNAAYGPLLTVKRTLGILEPLDEQEQGDAVTPSDLFRAMEEASRQFDELFIQRVSANNTVQQMTLANNHAVRLLEQFPGTTPLPAMPALEHGRHPDEVHGLLVKAYEKISAIDAGSGIGIMTLALAPPDSTCAAADQINASDVFDMAIILVSELSYLHGQLRHTDPPAMKFDPGYKVAAHVYQRATLLLLQLTELEKNVKKNPRWLTR